MGLGCGALVDLAVPGHLLGCVAMSRCTNIFMKSLDHM